MKVLDQIDYMMQSLQLAKDEINYAIEYKKKHNSDNWYDDNKRIPNGTIIRESLKMVGRLANITSSNVCLSPYSNDIFKED